MRRGEILSITESSNATQTTQINGFYKGRVILTDGRFSKLTYGAGSEPDGWFRASISPRVIIPECLSLAY